MPTSVAILYHPHRPRAVEEALWLEGALRQRDVTTFLGNGWDPDVVTELCCGPELLVVLGGDGTIIHVARLAAAFKVPILGVNLGRVGFLAELTPESLHDCVDNVLAGKFWIERRTMLDVEWRTDDRVDRFVCLNEVAVARGASPRAVHVDILLDDHPFMTYTADGVLVTTATGSTAYSLAAGGPIMYPEGHDIMLTPVAPHLHIGSSIIVPADTRLTLRLSTDRSAVLGVDGSDERLLTIDHEVHVHRSELYASFARLGPRTYFYSAISDRLK